MALTLTPLATDNFTPNANPLNPAKWSAIAGEQALQALSGNCEATTTLEGCGALYTGVIVPADQFIRLTLTNWIIGNSQDQTIYLRSDTDAENAYLMDLVDNGDGTSSAFIEKSIAGVTTVLAENDAVSFNSGDVIIGAVVGNKLFLYQNNILIASASDSGFSSGLTGVQILAPTTLTDLTFSSFSTGLAQEINMAATQYSVMRRYNSFATTAPYLASAFGDNESNADILQIENEGGQVVVAVDYLGNVHFSSTGLTASLGSGGVGLYTLNRQLDRKYRTVPGSTVTTVAQAFAAAFPTNPQNWDILQVIAPGGTIGYYISYLGVATGS